MRGIKHKLNQKGFMSIEAIMSMSVVLMVIVMGVSVFSYMIPRQAIEEDVHLLGRIAKMEGTLSEAHKAEFQDKMVDRGLAEKRADVKVEVIKESTSGLCPATLTQDTRVQRGDKYTIGDCTGSYSVIKIVASVPAKTNGVSGALGFFGVSSPLSEDYVFEERVMSEYYPGGGV